MTYLALPTDVFTKKVFSPEQFSSIIKVLPPAYEMSLSFDNRDVDVAIGRINNTTVHKPTHKHLYAFLEDEVVQRVFKEMQLSYAVSDTSGCSFRLFLYRAGAEKPLVKGMHVVASSFQDGGDHGRLSLKCIQLTQKYVNTLIEKVVDDEEVLIKFGKDNYGRSKLYQPTEFMQKLDDIAAKVKKQIK
ncbi:MAG: hypothetical protein WC916_01675 [Candidatus Woesearchaeota archaeon]